MTAISAPASPMTPAVPARRPLPKACSVLAVTARPGQESADLGGLVYAFRRAGASLGLLCLTRGEASPLNSACARLQAVRPWELQLAASVLGISWVAIASYPDGGLRRQPAAELAGRVRRTIRQYAPDLLLVPDPVGGGPDDTAVAAAAVAAARHAGVPVVARTWRGARGAWMIDLGGETATARAIQKSAAAAHDSQSGDLPRLTRRLDRLGGREHLRWLAPPFPEHAPRAACPYPAGERQSADVATPVPITSLAAAKAAPGHRAGDERSGQTGSVFQRGY
jgi:N-acetylglucosamine malate deacetylase 2